MLSFWEASDAKYSEAEKCQTQAKKNDDSFEDGEGDRYGAASHAVRYIKCKTEEKKRRQLRGWRGLSIPACLAYCNLHIIQDSSQKSDDGFADGGGGDTCLPATM